jgi:hypothetical protein
MGEDSLRIDNAAVNTTESCNNTTYGFFQDAEIAKKWRDGKPYVEFADLFFLESCPNGGKPRAPRVWIPGRNASWLESDAYFLLIRLLPLSQVDKLRIDSPGPDRTQLPDGTYLPDDATREKRQAAVDEYVLGLGRCLMRERMPLPKVSMHRYHKAGEPLYIQFESKASPWRPRFDEMPPESHEASFVQIDSR